MSNANVLTAEQVIEQLEVFPPNESEDADEQERVPHVMALGPFGSWPEPLDEALLAIRKRDEWRTGYSLRVGRSATWKRGWGYCLKRFDDLAPELHVRLEAAGMQARASGGGGWEIYSRRPVFEGQIEEVERWFNEQEGGSDPPPEDER